MRSPDWLQELRDVLAMCTHEERQQALESWEARWVVGVHADHLITEEEMVYARSTILTHVGAQIQRDIGQELARLMGELSMDPWKWNTSVVEVRGDAWAIRREPKVDA